MTDRWGQSKITTGFAVTNVLSDFTLTPAFMSPNMRKIMKWQM